METSSSKFTPVLKQITSPALEKTRILAVASTEKASKLLTPCRRVGLKRKSISSDVKKRLPIDISFNQNTCDESNNKELTSEKSFIPELPKLYVGRQLKSPKISVNSCSSNNSSCVNAEGIKYPNTSILKPVKENVTLFDTQIDNNVSNSGLLCRPDIITLNILDSLANKIMEKKAKYKRIELSMLYEKKHDLQTLKELTEKWKLGCQSALVELHKHIQENGHILTMSQLLAQFQIPHDSVGYSEDAEDFE